MATLLGLVGKERAAGPVLHDQHGFPMDLRSPAGAGLAHPHAEAVAVHGLGGVHAAIARPHPSVGLSDDVAGALAVGDHLQAVLILAGGRLHAGLQDATHHGGLARLRRTEKYAAHVILEQLLVAAWLFAVGRTRVRRIEGAALAPPLIFWCGGAAAGGP